MDLDKAIKKRQSVRSFKDKKPDWRDILSAIEAATHAPLAGNIQTLNNTLDDGSGNMIVNGTLLTISGQHMIIGLSTPTLASTGSNLYIRSTGAAASTNSVFRADVVGGGGGASIDLDFLT